MNTESNSKELIEKKDEKVPKGSGMSGNWFVVILSLLAVTVSGFAFWSVQKMSHNIGKQDVEFAKLEARLDSDHNALQAIKKERKEINDRIEGIDERQNKLDEGIARLYKNQASGDLDLAVAEIEHLIVIAVHSLTLQHNVATALAALQSADDRLRNLGDPALVEVRKQLTEDMNALQSVKSVDITGLSLYLADLVNRVEGLPLKDKSTAQQSDAQVDNALPEEQPAFKRLFLGIWQELKSLVVITHTGSGSKALLLPEEKYFLYQNLRLQLESARSAVLQRDTATFHASVEIVIEWLREYFDETDAGIQNIIQSLQGMLTLELDPDLPDISSSLETLKVYIKDRAGPVLPDESEPVS